MFGSERNLAYDSWGPVCERACSSLLFNLFRGRSARRRRANKGSRTQQFVYASAPQAYIVAKRNESTF